MAIKWIAELGSNHNVNKDRLINLIFAAKEIGCQAVKLQVFDERLGRMPENKKIFKERKLPEHFLSIAYHKCKELGLDLNCSVFHPSFVPMLDPFIDEFKIGSYELLWLDLIEACAKTRKPLSISTGGGTDEEIEQAYTKARSFLPKELITLYHCIPFYPANNTATKLYKIAELKYKYHSSFIGYSDHTTSPETIYNAIMAGAKEIEFHLDLNDMKGVESKYGHCLSVDMAKGIINISRSELYIFDAVIYEDMRAARTNPKDGMRGMG